MPYIVSKRKNKWVVVNTFTNKVKGTHVTKAKAETQRRLLEGVKRGWKPSSKKRNKK